VPLERALEQVAAERGAPVTLDVKEATIAMNAAQLGIALERLTDPERVGADLGERVARIAFERMADPR
jgi:hypothetical protein